jgi:hypothetical protein
LGIDGSSNGDDETKNVILVIFQCCLLDHWVQQDVRTVDNWELLLARHLAKTYQVPLHVVYALPPPPSPQQDGITTARRQQRE